MCSIPVAGQLFSQIIFYDLLISDFILMFFLFFSGYLKNITVSPLPCWLSFLFSTLTGSVALLIFVSFSPNVVVTVVIIVVVFCCCSFISSIVVVLNVVDSVAVVVFPPSLLFSVGGSSLLEEKEIVVSLIFCVVLVVVFSPFSSIPDNGLSNL